MSNSPFENPGDVTDRLRHWDHPDGLGWQLWRRVHATGLSTQQLQRALGRLRGHILLDRASLAADIRRRWGLNQGPAVHRFSLDLPLFYARFPLFYASPPHEPLSSTLQPLRHAADVPLVSGLSRKSPLVGASGLSRAIQMERPAQISSPTDTVFVRRGHDIPNLEQTPRLSWLSQGARSFGEAPGTATDNNVEESSHAGPHTEGGTQESAQRLVQRSTPAFDSINAKSDVKTFALMAASSKHQLSELYSPFIRHRDMLVLQSLMPQSLMERAVQYLPLNRRTGPLSTAIWPPDQPLRRVAQPLARALPATGPDSGSVLSYPTCRLTTPFNASARGDAAGMPRLTFPPGVVAEHRQAAPGVQRGISAPHAPVVQSHPGAYAVSGVASLPGLFTPPAVLRAATSPARLLRRESLAGDSHTAYPAFPMTRQVMRSVGEGQQMPLHRASAPRALGRHGGEMMAGEVWQAPMHRRDTGLRRAGYGSELATGQGWILPIVESTLQDRFTLRRPFYPHLTALHRFSSHAGAGDRPGDARVPMSRMSLVQPYYDRETRLHQPDNPTQAIMGRLSATRHLTPIREGEARTLTGTISLPTLTLRTGQRDIITRITRSRPSGKGGPASYIEAPGNSLPGVIEGGFGASEGHSIIGIGHRGPLLNPGRVRVDGFDEGYNLVQRSVSNLPAPLAIALWGETPAAVGDHRLTTSSTPGVIQPKEAVRPVWSRTVAATPAVMRSQAWSSIPALPLLHRFHPRAEHGEQISTVVVREPAHDMPLVPALRRENRDNCLWDDRGTGVVVQTSPQSLASATLGTALTGSAENAEVLSTETGASRSQIDLDEVVEKAWQKFMRKLTIEQERRGYVR